MLTSVVLLLHAARPTHLPPYLGRANQAQFLRRLAEVEPGADGLLHDIEGPKPFTCSNLNGTEILGDRKCAIATDRLYWVRFTGLTEPVSALLLRALWEKRPQVWQLENGCFEVVDVICDASKHAWSGVARYEELATAHILGAGQQVGRGGGRRNGRCAVDRVTLDFYSPTAFKSREMQIPLPMPGLVFGSMMARWNRFSPVELEPHMRQVGEEAIGVAKFNLRSMLVAQKNGGQRSGAVGQASYVALYRDAYWLSVFQMLADYAFYSGVGVMTTAGMGQVRRQR